MKEDPVMATSESETKQAAATLAIGTVAFGSALLLAHLLLGALFRNAPYDVKRPDLSERLPAMIQHLPQVAETKGDLVLLVGTSDTAFGLSPEVFDNRLHEKGINVTSYNLGMPSMSPDVERVFSRRVRNALDAKHRKAALTVVEFGPTLATFTATMDEGHVVQRAQVFEPRDLLALAARSPVEASDTVTLMLLGGVSPTLAPALVLATVDDGSEGGGTDLTYDSGPLLRVAVKHPGVADPWNLEWRGERRWNVPESAELYAEMVRQRTTVPKAMESQVDWLVREFDLFDLNIDPRALKEFIDAVRELSAVSERTVVLMAPMNSAWNKPTPAGRARLKSALAQISQETGAPVLDFSEATEFGTQDFMDIVHLNEITGRTKWSALLADRVAEKWSR
jgi:hypothetical protein